jgi:tetratricopeptide (TPR) repeat protein
MRAAKKAAKAEGSKAPALPPGGEPVDQQKLPKKEKDLFNDLIVRLIHIFNFSHAC